MRKKLKEVCAFYSGTGFPIQYQGMQYGDYPFYKVGDIANNAVAGNIYLELCNNYISQDVAREIRGCILPKDAVVFAKIGEAIKLNRRAITSCNCLIDNNAMGIAPQKDKIRIGYFFFFMKNLKIQELAESTTVPSVRKSRLEDYEIELPTLTQQKIIEEKLLLILEIIKKRSEELLYLDNLIKARFVEMFGNPEINSMKWNEQPLSEKLDVLGGYAFKSEQFDEEQGIPVLRIGNVNAGYFKSVNMVYWKEDESLERYAIYPGDLVMSLTGTVGKDDYGNVCILGSDYEKYYLNQRNAKLEIKNGLDKVYLSQLLKFEGIKKKLTGISRGVRQANIANKDILNLVVPIPPTELQNQFADFVRQVDKSKVVVQNHSKICYNRTIFNNRIL